MALVEPMFLLEIQILSRYKMSYEQLMFLTVCAISSDLLSRVLHLLSRYKYWKLTKKWIKTFKKMTQQIVVSLIQMLAVL